MGVGKTFIGAKLAKQSSRVFYDSDREIEDHAGTTINLIFEIEGESGFRRREAQILDKLTVIPGIVLATGGGAVLSEKNRSALVNRGFVVYLRADIEQLLKRIAGGTRPLLGAGEPRMILERLLAERAPLYELTADMTIDIDEYHVNDIISRIISANK